MMSDHSANPIFFNKKRKIRRPEHSLALEHSSKRPVHNIWTTLANALRRSLIDVPKLLEARILRQPSASVPMQADDLST